MENNLDIKAFLDKDEQKDLLRFLTAGSVDDGKSTLIGRLLFDSKKLYEDQLDALERDSKRMGNAGEHIDYALLLDGLKAEREQGITIDVAYRYFSTNNRKFIIADTPGHEQYTRNMITGGSTANLAIILVDARTGVITQTRRHTFLVSLLGIKHVVLAVNKMDLVDFSKECFDKIVKDYLDFVTPLGIPDVTCIPLSALEGDNVVVKSERTPWYQGSSLLDFLETVHIDNDHNLNDFRFPVQYVLRPNLDFRGFSGKVASGVVRKGDEVMALPSGKKSRIKSIVTYDGDLEYAFPPQSVTLTLEDEIDVSRGEMLVHPDNMPIMDRNFEAMMVWMDEEPMDMNKSFFIKQTTNLSRTRIDNIKYKVDVNLTEPTVQYRETIRGKAEAQGRYKKQNGGAGMFGDVWVRFEPAEDSEEMVFAEEVFGGAVPKQYFPPVEQGLRECMQKGVLAGYKVVGVKATLYDGSYHPVDSKEAAFKEAARLAYNEGMPKAKPVLLEPIGEVTITAPESYTGTVIGDLTKRRGSILEMNMNEDGEQVIVGEVPMREMLTYANELRSMTQGRGSYVIAFDRYEAAPKDVADAVIAAAKEKNAK